MSTAKPTTIEAILEEQSRRDVIRPANVIAKGRHIEDALKDRDATIADLQKQLEEQTAATKANSELVDHIEKEIADLRAENDRLRGLLREAIFSVQLHAVTKDRHARDLSARISAALAKETKG